MPLGSSFPDVASVAGVWPMRKVGALNQARKEKRFLVCGGKGEWAVGLPLPDQATCTCGLGHDRHGPQGCLSRSVGLQGLQWDSQASREVFAILLCTGACAGLCRDVIREPTAPSRLQLEFCQVETSQGQVPGEVTVTLGSESVEPVGGDPGKEKQPAAPPPPFWAGLRLSSEFWVLAGTHILRGWRFLT